MWCEVAGHMGAFGPCPALLKSRVSSRWVRTRVWEAEVGSNTDPPYLRVPKQDTAGRAQGSILRGGRRAGGRIYAVVYYTCGIRNCTVLIRKLIYWICSGKVGKKFEQTFHKKKSNWPINENLSTPVDMGQCRSQSQWLPLLSARVATM